MDSICDQLIQCVLDECTKEKNKEVLNSKVLDPIIRYIGRQLIPYIVFAVVFMSVALSILISILIYYVTNFRLKFKDIKT